MPAPLVGARVARYLVLCDAICSRIHFVFSRAVNRVTWFYFRVGFLLFGDGSVRMYEVLKRKDKREGMIISEPPRKTRKKTKLKIFASVEHYTKYIFDIIVLRRSVVFSFSFHQQTFLFDDTIQCAANEYVSFFQITMSQVDSGRSKNKKTLERNHFLNTRPFSQNPPKIPNTGPKNQPSVYVTQ